MKNLSMSNKLTVVIATFMTTLIIVVAMSHVMIARTADTGEAIYTDRLIPIQALGQLRTDNRALEGHLLELMLTTDSSRNEELQENI
ncbi:MCP four helix bundle domain-containing protein [Exiguobacterium alkaliphilum]|uniref:MCP four helix bundle domain-containing protein n=1 Tax=Exiguobacterium alkaliphilum TaxID=1428684 RepID=UPI00403A8FE6